ncbi:MAG: hypothetical protein GQ559_07595 [Desulfobulbaceae bacterium]|nr:hypothetical protein [Desulfobulbaceae bacterium]
MINEIRKATNGNFALGSSRFKQEISEMPGRRVTPGKAGRPRKKPLEVKHNYSWPVSYFKPEDRHALFRVIDSMLTKQKILKVISQENNIPAHVAS